MRWSTTRQLCSHFLSIAAKSSDKLSSHYTLISHCRHTLQTQRVITYSTIFACRKFHNSQSNKDTSSHRGSHSDGLKPEHVKAAECNHHSGVSDQSRVSLDEKSSVTAEPKPNKIKCNSDDDFELEKIEEYEDTSIWENNIQPIKDERRVAQTVEGQDHQYMLVPDSPPGARLLKVAVIGSPNCGKSTLTNTLMGWRVCSVSSKVHTTRKNTMAVYTEDETQIVFVDAPGTLKPGTRKKHGLERSLELDPVRSLASADLIIAMQSLEWFNARNRLDPMLLTLLHMYRHIPALLVLNKIDLLKQRSDILSTVRLLTQAVIGGESLDQWRPPRRQRILSKKERMFAAADKKLGLEVEEEEDMEPVRAVIPKELLEPPDPCIQQGEMDWDTYFSQLRVSQVATRGLRGWPLFESVFSVSALRRDGMADLKNYLMSRSYPAPWLYHSSLVTDQPPSDVVLLSVRQALLDTLMNEVPYALDLELVMMESAADGNLLNIIVNVICGSERQLTIFLGRDGKGIRRVQYIAKQAIMDTFRCEVRLKLVALIKRRK